MGPNLWVIAHIVCVRLGMLEATPLTAALRGAGHKLGAVCFRGVLVGRHGVSINSEDDVAGKG